MSLFIVGGAALSLVVPPRFRFGFGFPLALRRVEGTRLRRLAGRRVVRVVGGRLRFRPPPPAILAGKVS